MTSKKSHIHKINFTFLIPQIAVALLLIFIFRTIGLANYIIVGIAFYLLIAAYLKIIIPRSHRQGLKYFKKKEYEGAAHAFQTSYLFFKKHAWLDENRAYFLLSVSAISFTEMALGNAAYCFRMAGKENEAKKFEERLKVEFPNSHLLVKK